MKSLVFLVVLTFFCTTVSAQNGTVNIEQDPKIDELLKLYASVNSKAEFYQIQVGFGSYQKAQNLKTRVEQDFPNWYSKIEFESPTYRVRLGKFRTQLEAERKYLEVRKKYPDAMLLKPEKKNNKKTR
ncbi:MAG: SPOR domain-containing protein [Bacteroidota bacterium]